MVAKVKYDQDDTRRRFQEARDRYNKLNQGKFQTESLASDSNADEVMMATTLDYLRKIAERNQGTKIISRPNRADNSNKTPGLPVPLPVVPVAPEQLVVQERTNKLIDRLVKNTSKENTLKLVVTTLVDLTSTIERFTNTLIEKFGNIVGHWDSKFDKYADDQKKSDGWFTKVVRGLLGKSDHHQMSFAEALELFTKPIIKATRGTYEILLKQANMFAAAARGDKIADARKTLDESTPALSGLSETLFPEGSKARSVINFVKGIGEFFKSIGTMAEDKIVKGAAAGGFLGSIGGLLSRGLIGKAVALFGGIASFITAVVGSVAFASIYAFFKNPDQLGRMFTAIGTLFSDVIMPAMTYITKEFLPPLSAIFAGLMVAFDYLLDTVGTVVNEGLIFLIGTAIPEAAKLIGKQIDVMWQTIKKIFWRIAGIFGFGHHAEGGVFHNLLMAFVEFGDGLLEMIATVPTKILRMLNLDEMIGLQDDESIYGRIKRFVFVEIPEFLVKVFNGVMAYIGELKPLQYIQDKIQSIIDWFTGAKEEETASVITTIKTKVQDFFTSVVDLLTGWIPSWEDMKGWMRNMIPEGIPDFIKNWLNEKLSSVNESVSSTFSGTRDIAKEAYEKNKKSAVDAYETGKDFATNTYRTRVDPILKDIQNKIDNLPLDPWSRNTGLGGGAPIIYAPQTQNTTNNNMSSGGNIFDRIGIGTTSPPFSRLDEMVFRANPG